MTPTPERAPSRAAATEAEWLAHLATEGGVIVTATHRQAARVLAVHAEARRHAGALAWARPRVASLEQWLGTLCAAATARGVLPPVIDTTQSRMLWAEVLGDWETTNVGRLGAGALVSRAATVEAAMRAWRLWLEAGLPLHDLPPAWADEEAACLAAWTADYRRRLAGHGLLDRPLALERLPSVLATTHLAGARHLRLLGFLELPPAHQRLLAACTRLGLTVTGVPTENSDAPALPDPQGFQGRHAPDPETERRAAARWARAWLCSDPAARIAIVVPDIDTDAVDLQRVLDETLQPQRHYRGGAAPAPVYDLAWTPSLSHWPVVADALAILGFGVGTASAPAADWTRLLLSPCIAGAAGELDGRVRVDRKLRRTRIEPWTAASVLAGATRDAPQWARLFAGLGEDARVAWANPAPPSTWAQRFQERLARAGWPGDAHRDDPALHQAVQQFVERLEALASLDALLPPLEATAALARLGDLVEAQSFRPRTAPCRLDVIPPEELPGLAWDAVWVLGMTANAFPQPIHLPPFLPAARIRECALPGSAAAQLARARRWLAALVTATPEGTLSAPLRIGEETHELAPLLAGWLPRPEPLPAQDDGLSGLTLEAWQDDRATPLPPGRHAGSRHLLADQSECPFRAWARHRVRAEAPPLPARGIEARHRGEWLHAALATLWRAIGDSRTLAEASDPQREAWLDEAIRGAEQAMRATDGRLTGSRYLRLESARLRDLLARWLEVEAGRLGEFVVSAVETEIPCAIGVLDLRLRPDRVDRLADGARVVVDYKSGTLRPAWWLAPRPRDPQPALYALALTEPAPPAVLFAQPERPDTPFSGFATDATQQAAFGLKRVQGAPADFASLLAEWETALAGLAREYASGEARVTPLAGACRYCDLGPLCRVDTLRRDATLAEEAAEPGDDVADD